MTDTRTAGARYAAPAAPVGGGSDLVPAVTVSRRRRPRPDAANRSFSPLRGGETVARNRCYFGGKWRPSGAVYLTMGRHYVGGAAKHWESLRFPRKLQTAPIQPATLTRHRWRVYDILSTIAR